MTDLALDHEGNIIVRFCGCPGHGPVTLWEMHDLAWRAAHRAEAVAAVQATTGQAAAAEPTKAVPTTPQPPDARAPAAVPIEVSRSALANIDADTPTDAPAVAIGPDAP